MSKRTHLAKLAKGLKRALRAKGLTQEQLARQINVSTNTVSRWCRGVHDIALSDAVSAADALDIGMDELLSRPGRSRTHAS